MGVFETFTKRLEKSKTAGKSDVVQYDDLPKPFRVQVIHIWNDALSAGIHPITCDSWWDGIEKQLSRELGKLCLSEKGNGAFQTCQHFLLTCSTSEALDLIEMTFRFVDVVVRGYLDKEFYRIAWAPHTSPDDAIGELNARFLEHSIGYEFASGRLLRKDSQYIHSEAVVPALRLLAERDFAGANEEFLDAHEHYRHARNKSCMQEALKAFESTLKSICDLRKWGYQSTDTAKKLIAVVINQGLIPPFFSSQLSAFVTFLESGLPTVRNKLAGHGQGSVPVDVPPYLAAFALHAAATNIVMLVEAHKALK